MQVMTAIQWHTASNRNVVTAKSLAGIYPCAVSCCSYLRVPLSAVLTAVKAKCEVS